MTFIVITVAEFDDVPILCVRSFHDPNDGKKLLLRERTIYVRNSNAESAPLCSVEELRALIGRATLKRADHLLAVVNVLMKGGSLRGAPTDEEQFAAAR